jgi:putative FmdB family regulatory protein
MPLYEYKCGNPSCNNIHEEGRPSAYRDVSAECPICGSEAERIYSTGQTFVIPHDKPAVYKNAAGETVRRVT